MDNTAKKMEPIAAYMYKHIKFGVSFIYSLSLQ